MNNNWGHPTWTQVPQSRTFTISGAGGGSETWTFTFTDDDGTTQTVTFTDDGSPTVAEVATGCYEAWEAATHPALARISATNPSDGVVKLTADTAGIPFTVTLAASGTGTVSTEDTVANVGNNDGSLDRNWSQNDAPDTGDDLIFEPGNVSWKYGLNQSGVAIADFKVQQGCQSEYGRFEYGKFHYLRIDPDSFDYRGSGGLNLFDIGSANINMYVEAYGSQTANGRHVVYLKGSDIATLEVAKGNVGVAVLDADTATVATILCGLLENPQADVNLTIGSGVTLTTLTQSAGSCTLRCAATTVSVYPGATLYTEGTGTIGTLHIYEGGTAYLKSSGTITTMNLFGTADFSRDLTAKTVTTLNHKKGGTLVKHDNITVSTYNPPTSSGGAIDTIVAS